ncbi:MAG: AAA family ATPase [Candidatus Hydrothermarchaeota archaeon]
MITRVSLKNWKCHRNSELYFSDGSNGIVGNVGSGKSSVMDAIVFALFGSFPKLKAQRIRLDDVLMRKPYKEKSSTVTVDFIAPDGKEYTVKRVIERGKGTVLSEIRYKENNRLLEGPNSTKVTEFIERTLKVDYELFTRAIYGEQNKIDAFLEIPKGKRKNKIDELLRLEKFEQARRNAHQIKNVCDNFCKGLESAIEGFDLEKEREEIKNYEKKIEKIDTEIKKITNEIKNTENEIESVKKELNYLSALEKEYNRILNEIEFLKKRKEELEKKISFLTEGIDPSLLELKNIEEEIEKLNLMKKEKKEEIKRNREVLDRKTREEASLSSQIKSMEEKIRNLERDVMDLEENEKELKYFVDRYKSLESIREEIDEIISKTVSREKDIEKEISEKNSILNGLLLEKEVLHETNNNLKRLKTILESKEEQMKDIRKELSEVETLSAQEFTEKVEEIKDSLKNIEEKIKTIKRIKDKVEEEIKNLDTSKEYNKQLLIDLNNLSIKKENILLELKNLAPMGLDRFNESILEEEGKHERMKNYAQELRLRITESDNLLNKLIFLKEKCPVCDSKITPEKRIEIEKNRRKELENYKEELEKAEKMIKKSGETLSGLREKKEKISALLHEKKILDEKLLKKEEVEEKCKKLTTELKKLKRKKENMLRKLENFEKLREKKTKELTMSQVTIGKLESLERLKEEINSIKKKIDELEAQKVEKRLKDVEMKIDNLKSSIQELMNSKKLINAKCREKIADLEKNYEKFRMLKRDVEEKKKKKSDLEILGIEIKEKVKEKKIVEKLLKETRINIEKFEMDLEEIEGKIEDLKKIKEAKEIQIILEEVEKSLEHACEKQSELKYDPERLLLMKNKSYELVEKREKLKGVINRENMTRKIYLENIETLRERISDYEKKRKKIENMKYISGQIQIFSDALEATQISLRREFIDAVNSVMSDIWKKLYPYGDYQDMRLFVDEKGDYILQLKERNGEWIDVEGLASGGERSIACVVMRVAFSMVLARNLSWLILDEPTHNLDTLSISKLSSTLKEGITDFVDQIFLITHEESLEDAITGSLYRMERDKDSGGITHPVLISSGEFN